jgi:hypothetical protein
MKLGNGKSTIFRKYLMVIKKELVTVISLTIGGFIIGVIPWILLLFEKTKSSVHWLRDIGFQYWGWLVVFGMTGYAFFKTLRSKNISKITRMIIMVVSLAVLAWSLLWALLIVCGLVISAIV